MRTVSPRRIGLLFREYIADVLQVVGTGALALAGLSPALQWSSRRAIALLSTGVLLNLGSVVYDRLFRRPTLRKVSKELEASVSEVTVLKETVARHTADIVAIVNILLRELAETAHIWTSDTRISVYRHERGSFCLVGRVSPNGQYARVGRESYPDTEGFISIVWDGRENRRQKVTFPANRSEWEEMQVHEYGISRDVARALRMHTRAMCATVIRIEPHGKRYGVLCVESDKPRATVTGTTLGTLKETRQFGVLSEVLAGSVTNLSQEAARDGLQAATR